MTWSSWITSRRPFFKYDFNKKISLTKIICYEWLSKNIPVDKNVLGKWHKTGYVYQNQWLETTAGTPQGVISPTLANMVLDGMESLLSNITKKRDKVHLVKYADDFLVTVDSKNCSKIKSNLLL